MLAHLKMETFQNFLSIFFFVKTSANVWNLRLRVASFARAAKCQISGMIRVQFEV